MPELEPLAAAGAPRDQLGLPLLRVARELLWLLGSAPGGALGEGVSDQLECVGVSDHFCSQVVGVVHWDSIDPNGRDDHRPGRRAAG